MVRLKDLRSTISAAVIATMLAGCASSGGQPKTHFGGRSGSDLGLATRALAALTANHVGEAVALAERAVEKTPGDAGFRTLLGNCYFAAGRFASAEQAYKDALSLYQEQPQTVLKLALVQIAQGKNASALAFLEAGRGQLDPADYGLALALAGQPRDAVAVLDVAARGPDADSRIRQNLALAYALSGDWQQARIIASQDVAPSDLEVRLQQWMALSNPAQASDQVAALIGVSPALSDPGQPVRLALVGQTETRTAEAAPVVLPDPVAQAPVAVVALPEPLAPVALPAPPPPPQIALAEVAPEPAFTAAVPPPPPPTNPLRVAASSPAEVPLALAAVARTMAPKIKAAVVRASLTRATGRSDAVVQLGAYRSARRVEAAWTSASRKFAALRGYQPTSAAFNSNSGLVYRLSVKGFGSRAEASRLCATLKRSGGGCFVRSVAGDRPIQFASR